MNTNYSDLQITTGLASGDRKIYEFVFRKYYIPLCRFCLKFVRVEEVSEEVVQEVFVYIWERRAAIEFTSSLQAYLYAAVKNRSINYIRSQVTREQHLAAYTERQDLVVSPKQDHVDREELIILVRQAIDSLPDKCKHIFSLSRDAGLTYQEIAHELGISPKTVEAQMSIALKKLRSFVGAHKDLILFWTLVICLL